MLKDHRGRFLILCPETDLSSVILLAKRMQQAITERIDLKVQCGVASFPDEALTFEDLMKKAYERLSTEMPLDDLVILENTPLPNNVHQETS